MIKNNLQLKTEREELQRRLQQEFYGNLSYREKLIKIYRILMKSQIHYQFYKNKDIFNEGFLHDMLAKLASIDNDIKFFEFVNNNLIKPLDSGHVELKFNNEYINGLIELYERLQNMSIENEKIKEFLEVHSLDSLIQELMSIEDLNDRKFENFLKKNIFKVVSMEKLMQGKEKNSENLSIIYSNDTVIITFKSFSRKYLEQDKLKFSELNAVLENNDFKNVIIDIRGNSGGTDEYFEYFKIISNKAVIKNSRWHNLFTKENEQNSWEAIPKGTNKEYDIYLLVDSKVFSTAQAFTDLCRSNNLATIVGERTLGEGYGMTPLSLQLCTSIPLMLRFPIEAPINVYGDIDYENCYSTIPDIECKSDEALDIALAMINQKTANLSGRKI